jgi:hypothetical protein
MKPPGGEDRQNQKGQGDGSEADRQSGGDFQFVHVNNPSAGVSKVLDAEEQLKDTAYWLAADRVVGSRWLRS